MKIEIWQTNIPIKGLENIWKTLQVTANRKIAEVEIYPKDTIILKFKEGCNGK